MVSGIVFIMKCARKWDVHTKRVVCDVLESQYANIEKGDAVENPSCRKVIRGGSWNDDPTSVRSTVREWNFPYTQNGLIGFRVVRDDD